MELGQTLTPTLEQTFNTILSSLASFFGTTTDIIMSNAPEWLAKYGWYTIIKDLPFALFIGIIVSSLCLVIIIGVIFDDDIPSSKIWTIIIIIFFATIAIIIILTILPCVVAPELVGLEAAIALISK